MSDEAPVVADYDRMWSEVYGDLQNVGPTHRHMARLLRRMLRDLDYESLLEVGVGFGHNLPVLTAGRKLRTLAGVDISERAVNHVRQHSEGRFSTLDITRQRLDETYDLVCSVLVMEHVGDDVAAFRNMRAMTGRYLLVVTIGGDFRRYRPWEEQMGHVRNYRPGELEDKLTQTGFEVLQTVSWGFPFYSPIARTLQNHMTASAELNRQAWFVARILYLIFFLNSRRRGDLLIALARPR